MEKVENEDSFMKVFKYYKANNPKPCLDDVISVGNYQNVDKVRRKTLNVSEDKRAGLLGLQSINDWQIYEFEDHPGLFLIRNPFTSLGQRYWIRQCLESYPKKPNKINIDAEVMIDDWWKECHANTDFNQQLIKKLRWSTLGYHHNWNTKKYSEDNWTSFPADLAELSDVVARYLGYTQFSAEAAIVNYYHMKSTLSAHTDHSEVNLEAPLFSFSFGQSAIFLIGGSDKTIAPSPVLLQTGDIMIMSKQARVCYHAVPKILPTSSRTWDENISKLSLTEIPLTKFIENPKEFVLNMEKNSDNAEWSMFSKYVEESRINMNVRQVLHENQTSLTDPVFIGTFCKKRKISDVL